MPDIICLGELLIDFISTDRDSSLLESGGFLKAPGGAPANVAVGVTRLGVSSGFIGKIGDDPFGDYLKKVLDDCGVDTKNLVKDNYAKTTLSFVALKSDGVRDCTFYRNPGADMLLNESEIDCSYFENANIFHFGSISLGSPDSEKATIKAINYAKKQNLLLSYDPNLRLSLWSDENLAKEKINSGFYYADFVKISDEESEFITGKKTPEEVADYIMQKGCKLVAVTLGKNGCYFTNGKISGYLPCYEVDVVETTGAGDAFVSGVLVKLNEIIKKSDNKTVNFQENFEKIMTFANTAAALATTKMGAIPSLPTLNSVLKCFK